MKIYDQYMRQKFEAKRSLGYKAFRSVLPERLKTKADTLRDEGLSVKLIAVALDGGRPSCFCGKNTPQDKHKYRFLTHCSEKCAERHKSSFIEKLKFGLKEQKSSYFVSRYNKTHVEFRCVRCSNSKRRRHKAALVHTCPCNKGNKIGLALRTEEKVFKAKYLTGRKLKLVSTFTKMNASHTFKCTCCGSKFDALAANVALRNSGCPDYSCANHKARVNCLANHGVSYNAQRPSTKKKFKATMLRRYGVEHPSQVAEFAAKNRSYKHKPYTLGDKEIRVQGYEPLALDYILAYHNVTSQDIECGAGSRIPNISYMYKGKSCVYFPDMYIPKFNRLVEVKSQYTWDKAKDRTRAKALACIAQGFEFTLLVMNPDGTLCKL